MDFTNFVSSLFDGVFGLVRSFLEIFLGTGVF